MSENRLSEDQMIELEKAIEQCGTDSLEIMNKIRQDYMSNVGGSWMGPAANAALRKQEDFSDEWKKIEKILEDLLNGVSTVKNRVLEFSEEQKRAFEAMNLGEDGTLFNTRMGG